MYFDGQDDDDELARLKSRKRLLPLGAPRDRSRCVYVWNLAVLASRMDWYGYMCVSTSISFTRARIKSSGERRRRTRLMRCGTMCRSRRERIKSVCVVAVVVTLLAQRRRRFRCRRRRVVLRYCCELASCCGTKRCAFDTQRYSNV